MFKRLSFRQKIFLSQCVLFLIFAALLFPFVEKTVHKIVRRSLQEETGSLIDQLRTAKTEDEMVQRLKMQELFVFFRVSLLNEKGELIYDSYLTRTLGERFQPLYPSSHPEVLQALKDGEGYSEGYSDIFAQKFAYSAELFHFQGKLYILRTAFPFTQLQELTSQFEVGFLLFSLFALLIFSGMTWFAFYRLSLPIQQIIQAVRPYKTGHEERLPHITLKRSISDQDEFGRLAHTLNSLSERIQNQIQQAVEERNEKEAILESLGEGVIALDAEETIRYVNFIGSKMLEIPKRQLLGKTIFEIEEKYPTFLVKRCAALLKACQDRATVLTDSVLLENEKRVYLDLIAAPKLHGKGAILVLQDKSSHYKVLEVGKDFVANASHELRTPITIIKGFAETLQDLPEMSPEMLSDITEKIVRNCQRMDTLIKNLLTLADIDNLPDSRFQSCDLVALVENCRDLLLSVHPTASVIIKKGSEIITIAADPDILELAIMNLLENAVKYSRAPAHISVSIQQLGEEVELVIQDKGIGIPPEDVEHVFDRFYTVNKAHSRRLGGAGLGLSIVKNIIEKHGGTISVASKLGEGTAFTLLLPTNRLTH